jgi:hypothetical protein
MMVYRESETAQYLYSQNAKHWLVSPNLISNSIFWVSAIPIHLPQPPGS